MIPVGGLTSDAEREELKNALIAAQESAALQILLESCIETEEDVVGFENLFYKIPSMIISRRIFFLQRSKARRWSLREAQSLICSFLHQSFIADPSLCKLVHFQVL